MAKQTETQAVSWFHFRFRVPAEWEVTSYSVGDRVGRLEFSTRKGYQALVGWEPLAHVPEPETLMMAFLRKGALDPDRARQVSIQDLKTRRVGRFLVGWLSEGDPCQAMLHLGDEGTLLHWVFSDYAPGTAEKLWFPVLESFEPNDGELRHYQVYGLDVQLPAEYLIEDMTVLPANVMMAFESRRKARITFRRWGIPEMVLQGRSLASFYDWFLHAQGCRVESKVIATTVAGMDAVRAVFMRRGEHKMDRFMGRLWKDGQAVLWFDRKAQRIYSCEQIGPPRVPLLDVESVFPFLCSHPLEASTAVSRTTVAHRPRSFGALQGDGFEHLWPDVITGGTTSAPRAHRDVSSACQDRARHSRGEASR